MRLHLSSIKLCLCGSSEIHLMPAIPHALAYVHASFHLLSAELYSCWSAGIRRTWKRQYLFVAATMPSGAGQTVAGDLGRLFPDLLWLSGTSLHEAQRRVSHTWLPVTQDTWRSTLQACFL